ncbi:hypothetical protein ACJX0J_017185, partial [Zea mays]
SQDVCILPGDTIWGSHYKTLLRIETFPLALRENNITQDHYFRVDIFYATIDSITTEFDHRFNEIYLDDFSLDDREAIKYQLATFIIHVRRLEDLAIKMCFHCLLDVTKIIIIIGITTPSWAITKWKVFLGR